MSFICIPKEHQANLAEHGFGHPHPGLQASKPSEEGLATGGAGVEQRDWERQELRKISFPSKDSQASVNILLPPPAILQAAVQAEGTLRLSRALLH